MTTTVTVQAHCHAEKTEVVVSVTGEPDQVLQDGQATEVYAYDDRVISVAERDKQAASAN